MDDSANIRRRILGVLSRALSVNLSEEEALGTTRLDQLFGMDSMASLEFLIALEREFGLTFSSEQMVLDLLRDLPRLAAFIEERITRADD